MTSLSSTNSSLIAQEHNRKPSDPNTRRLFEDMTDESRLRPKWKSVTSASNMQASPKEGHFAREDASSCYLGEGELPDSGAASLMDIVHSETIKNPNSLAVPSRRASASMGQRYGSFGRFSNAEEGEWLGDNKHKKHHSLERLEDALAPHEKGPEVAPAIDVNEGMSEISEGALQEKRRGRMSEIVPDTLVLRASHESRSISEGWLSQGRRSGWGYDFIERTPSRDTRPSGDMDKDKRPRSETATVVWDRAFKKAREEGPVGSSSKSMLSVPFWSDMAGRRTSRSSFNEQQARHLRRQRSVASERKPTPSDLTRGHLDPLESHQRMVAEAWKPLPRLSAQWSFNKGEDSGSQVTPMDEGSRKHSLFDIRCRTIAGRNEGSTASPAAIIDFPSWARFPSHTRKERCLSREAKYPELEIPASFGSLKPFKYSPTPQSRRNLDQARITEYTDDGNREPVEHGGTEVWHIGTGINIGHETENCFLAREARRWPQPKAIHERSSSKGFGGTVSSRSSKEHVGDVMTSDSDWSFAQQNHGNGTYGSFISVTASNSFGNGSGNFGVQPRQLRLASTELRDSTTNFRTALTEREQRSRNDLLRLAQGLDGLADGDGNGEEVEERKETGEEVEERNETDGKG